MTGQEKQEDSQPAGEQAEDKSETNSAASGNRTGQPETEEQARDDEERAGEGTGARAGEYS